MQTQLPDAASDSVEDQRAKAILRTCVHCGFCLATCPTYQILGNELDSPRGRIYLMKQLFEGMAVSHKTLTHLDRCLTCRSCETTCPSGVRFGKLLDIGRHRAEEQVVRPLLERVKRAALNQVLPRPGRFSALLKVGRLVRPLLPTHLRAKIPNVLASPLIKTTAANGTLSRKMVVLQGCVQPALAPQINAAAARVLQRLGIELMAADGARCCGAVSFHLNYQEQGRDAMRRNIDAWWPHVQAGAEAIVTTASGCGVTVKDYGHYLADDPTYSKKAEHIARLAKDIAEIVFAERNRLLERLKAAARTEPLNVAWHAPCTLQHGQQINGVVETLLTAAGYDVQPPMESHLCCGSAGAYSLLEPGIAMRLRDRKLGFLLSQEPEVIATANIGCLAHLQSGTPVPVRHWIELLAEAL
ncbi:MAG: glycolate oxidase subunit GlcF [Thiobacillaceae bacterium]